MDGINIVSNQINLAEKSHKNSAKSFKNSEKGFKTLVENANDGIIVIKMDGNIVYTNKCFAKICGYNDLGFLKHSIDSLIEPVERAKIRKILQGKFGENPVPDRFDFKLITKSGRAVPVEATASRTTWQRQSVSMMIVSSLWKPIMRYPFWRVTLIKDGKKPKRIPT